ncbi:MAG: hypothetical protein IBX67_00300 [Dehalococcoidia bacterium]|nr:hypothetical protein [Dehalococcoidia bacterium]
MPNKLFDKFGRPKKVTAFSGVIYHKRDTATSGAARRFETEPTYLMDATFLVSDATQLFGNATEQQLNVAANNYLRLTYVDLSTLWFKNLLPGSNGRVTVIGTRL